MKNRAIQLSVLVAAVVILSSGARAQESSTKAAQTSVEEWLSLIDHAQDAASWETAASLFKKAVTQPARPTCRLPES
jgi:outer membrane protein assembly factor BamD (BamD/ComL family)